MNKKIIVYALSSVAVIFLATGAAINPAVIVEYLAKISGTTGNLPAISAAGQLYDSGISTSTIATTTTLSGYQTKIVPSAAGNVAKLNISGQVYDGGITRDAISTLTDANITSAAQGDILYYAGDGKWGNLHAGDSGKFLKTQGAAANPTWDTAGGGVTAATQITASGAMTKNYIYSNYAANQSYTMTLPAGAGLANGDTVGIIHEASLFQNDILAPLVASYLKIGYKFSSGALTADTIGSNTLTASVSAPTEGTGKDGGGASLAAASNQYYYIASPGTDWQSTSAYSISLWCNPASVPAGGGQIYLFRTQLDSHYFSLGIYETGGQLKFEIMSETTSGDYSDSSTVTTAFVGSTWVHYAIVVDGASQNVKVYENGTLKVTMSASGTTLKAITNQFAIGARQDGATRWFNGIIDEFYFFKGYALTQAQITELSKTAPAFIAATNRNLTVDADGTDRILGLTNDAGNSLISYGNDVLFLRWTGYNWCVDRSYGTWTDNN
jgi:hypothetical protein